MNKDLTDGVGEMAEPTNDQLTNNLKEPTDFDGTAQVIERMARLMEHYATEMRNHAEKLRDGQDWEYAGFAVQSVQNLFNNLRLLNLLVARPIRVLERKLYRSKDNA